MFWKIFPDISRKFTNVLLERPAPDPVATVTIAAGFLWQTAVASETMLSVDDV